MSEDPSNVDDVISEVDALISAEDPDFVEQLSEIKINNAMADLSLMEQVLVDTDLEVKKPFYIELKTLVDFKNNSKRLVPFWSFVFAVGFGIVFTLKIFSWNQPDSLFLTSYAKWGVEVHSYNPMTESEMFFDNSKILKNIITINKLVANIKPSETSGKNPMLAFEINIDGMTSEVIVEIKDREAEFKDLILRTAEDYTYDSLLSGQGKQALSDHMLNVINTNLTQGQVRKVLYKSFILKN
jgi:flagellar basal body-associated protein FliL